jgi:Flp pilus assembly pilin Flp
VKKLISSVWSNDDGQDLAEYGLLLALVAVVVATVIITFRGAIVTAFNNAIAAF